MPKYIPDPGLYEGAIKMRTTIFHLISSERMAEHFANPYSQRLVVAMIKNVLASEISV